MRITTKTLISLLCCLLTANWTLAQNAAFFGSNVGVAGGGGFTYVQSVAPARVTGTSITCNMTSTVAGNLIGITAFTPSGGVTGNSVTDSASETYIFPSGQHGYLFTYFKENNVGGVTTITFSSTSSQITGAICFEYSPGSGSQDGNLIDGNLQSGTTYTSGALTGTSGTSDLLLGFVINRTSSSVTLTPNAPFSVRKEYVDAGAGDRYSMVDALNTSPTSVANSGSFSSGTNSNDA